MTPVADPKRIAELRRRYNEQSREFWELRDARPEARASEISDEQRTRAALRGAPLLTNTELLELYEALPNDPREPERPRDWNLVGDPPIALPREFPEPPPPSFRARLVDWLGQKLFGGSWR